MHPRQHPNPLPTDGMNRKWSEWRLEGLFKAARRRSPLPVIEEEDGRGTGTSAGRHGLESHHVVPGPDLAPAAPPATHGTPPSARRTPRMGAFPSRSNVSPAVRPSLLISCLDGSPRPPLPPGPKALTHLVLHLAPSPGLGSLPSLVHVVKPGAPHSFRPSPPPTGASVSSSSPLGRGGLHPMGSVSICGDALCSWRARGAFRGFTASGPGGLRVQGVYGVPLPNPPQPFPQDSQTLL